MDISNIRKGMPINWKGGVWIAMDVTFVNPGKGSAFYRVKLKNAETGKLVENTFKSSESIDEASVTQKAAQFLYHDGTTYHFMDNETYEEVELPAEALGKSADFLKDNIDMKLIVVNDRYVGIELPTKMVFAVTDAPPGVKGDSATGKVMPITIETGATVMAPLFVKTGDKIRINTETGEYVERV